MRMRAIARAQARRAPAGNREVFRSPGAAILWWAWAAVAAFILIDLAVQGRGRSALLTALVVVAITGVAYATAWRPRVMADTDGIVVANPLREHHVPWLAIAQIEAVNALRVHCVPVPGTDRGAVITSWAVQSSPRSAAKREFADRRAAQRGRRAGFAAGTRYASTSTAREAVNQSLAEYAAQRLAERVHRARQVAASSQPGSGAAGGEHPIGGQGPAGGREQPTGGLGSPGDLRPRARWAWPAIAAMVVPVLAVVVVALI